MRRRPPKFRFASEWTLGAGRDRLLGAELAGALGWCFRQLSLFSEGTYWCGEERLSGSGRPGEYRLGADPRSLLLLHARAPRRSGRKTLNAMCALQHLGSVWAHRGDHMRAALLFGASNRLYADFGLQREFTERALYDRTIATLRAHFTEEAPALRLHEGSSLSTDRAIDEALQP